MTLHSAFLSACWFQILLPYIKKSRLAPVVPTAGHSHLTIASVIGRLCGLEHFASITASSCLCLLICIK